MKSKLLKQVLEEAIKNSFALPAFNTINMECTQAIVEAADEKKASVILQITESSINFAGFDYIEAILKIADKSPYVFVHLDHGKNLNLIEKCLLSPAFSSVMIDFSTKSFEENTLSTKNIKDLSKDKMVEAELGIVGGKEEDIIAEIDSSTKLEEALSFVERTGIDLFAPSVGTAHGVYKAKPNLNYNLIKELRQNLPNTALVLHGSSGLSDEQVRNCIKNGMNKINIDTELKQNYVSGFLTYMVNNPEAYDLRKILSEAKQSMKNIVLQKIDLCGSAGKIK